MYASPTTAAQRHNVQTRIRAAFIMRSLAASLILLASVWRAGSWFLPGARPRQGNRENPASAPKILGRVPVIREGKVCCCCCCCCCCAPVWCCCYSAVLLLLYALRSCLSRAYCFRHEHYLSCCCCCCCWCCCWCCWCCWCCCCWSFLLECAEHQPGFR